MLTFHKNKELKAKKYSFVSGAPSDENKSHAGGRKNIFLEYVFIVEYSLLQHSIYCREKYEIYKIFSCLRPGNVQKNSHPGGAIYIFGLNVNK